MNIFKKLLVVALISTFTAFSFAQNYGILNGGFEQWEGSGESAEPTHWNCFMTASGSGLAYSGGQAQQIVSSSDIRPGSSGAKSVKIYARSVLGVIANGLFSTGQVNMGSITPSDPSNHVITRRANSNFNLPLNGFPDSISFWGKFVCPSTTQYARMNAVLHDSYDYCDPEAYDANASAHVVAKATREFTRGAQSWTKYTVPFNYNFPASTPAYLLVTFTTNRTQGEGSANDALYIDDVELIYNANLSNIQIAGISIPNFDQQTTIYYDSLAVENPASFASQTLITATTASSHATYQITQATLANPVATITVTNGTATKQYQVFFVLDIEPTTQNVLHVSTSGNDNNDGSDLTPLRTLGRAVSIANPDNATLIKVASGSYTETQIVEMKSNLTIEGGFDGTTWEKNNAATTLTFNTLERISDEARKIAFRSVNDTNWLIKDFAIQVSSATTSERGNTGKGATVYGLYQSGASTGNRMENCQITAGSGGSGLPGTAGSAGTSGNAGTAGGNGGLSSLTNDGDNPGVGGAAVGSGSARGGKGGNGSAGAEGNGNRSSAGSAGTHGGLSDGGAGGSGGAGVAAGTNGKVGTAGSVGPDGTDGTTNVTYSWNTYFIPAGQSANGTDGKGGGGGGGGSGGGSSDSWVGQYCGGAGGGGGGGGTGGKGGTGGFGGGGSFGIYCYETQAPELLNVTIQRGSAGTGGSGGSGGSGGVGGSGGAGGSCSSTGDAGTGGRGGAGGRGGTGGRGGAGAIGYAAQIVVIENQTISEENITAPIAQSLTVCATDTATLTAQPGFNGTTCRWYASETETTILATDTIFRIAVSGSVTYYVSTYNENNGVESAHRSAVNFTFRPQPTAPQVADVFRCDEGIISLQANIDSDATTCRWYNNIYDDEALFTGLFFNDTISATTTYYTTSYDELSGCESDKVPVVATIGAHSDTTLFAVTLCAGESYLENGFYFENANLNHNGTYYLLHSNAVGCDSIVRLDLAVNATASTTLRDTIVQGEEYHENGFNLASDETQVAGNQTLRLDLQTTFGCDSTVFLYLKILADDTEPDTIPDPTSIAEHSWVDAISVYPNPTISSVQLKIEQFESLTSSQSAYYTIFNLYGMMLKREQIVDVTTEIDMSDFAAGIYFLRVENQTLTSKMIKIIKK